MRLDDPDALPALRQLAEDLRKPEARLRGHVARPVRHHD